MTASDEELFVAIQADDARALEALFSRYYSSLCSFASQFIDASLAEEAVADVFMKVWQKRQELIVPDRIRSYLFVVTKNHALNLSRSEQRFFISLDEPNAHLSALQPTPLEKLELTELETELEELVNELPSQRRLVFRMHRIEGFKYQEIAEILGVSVNTVEKQMGSALKYLRLRVENKPISLIIFLFSDLMI